MQDIEKALTGSVSTRYPRFTVRRLGFRHHRVLRLVPEQEWHPPCAVQTGEVTVQCDASFSPRTHDARAGIVAEGTVRTVDLRTVKASSCNHAEFFALCLAMLTAAADRRALCVYSDSRAAIQDARRLYGGLLPGWLVGHNEYDEQDGLAVRLAIAAMTSTRLRPVQVRWAHRGMVRAAHHAASLMKMPGEMMLPRTWARQQGIHLSWNDEQRSVARPGRRTAVHPEFLHRHSVRPSCGSW
ncbi:RNase H family protein [Streptomyces decoyicus]|uniref:RNase H family protein n=1 Tax=Streptomyces decoyicus TaxID=249567 RepID=UPI00364A7775